MKPRKVILTLILLLFCSIISAQVAINDDGSPPKSSAGLDITFTDKGLLPPRLTETERDAIVNPEPGLQVFNTTTHNPNYFNGSIWINFDGSPAQELAIGDYYQGGVVFYLDGDGGGMVCTITDISAGVIWGCSGINLTTLCGGYYCGNPNTDEILSSCPFTTNAAYLCYNYIQNHYHDWFLPSVAELESMYLNRLIINETSVAFGGSAFYNSPYWSSNNSDASYSHARDFLNGTSIVKPKTSQLRVRAAREF